MTGNIENNELIDENIFKLIEYGKTVDEMEKIFKLCKNLYQLLNFILIKFDHILNIYKAVKKK